jgi:hypothetical protein
MGSQAMVRHETQGETQGQRQQALIQARFVMAMQRPRDIDAVRLALLKECKRPTFAGLARWERSVGRDKITGWSIRFVEAAIRCMRHADCSTETLYDSAEKRIIRCSVIDYESGASWSQEVSIEKTKERKQLREGEVPLSQRRNSYGDLVYLLPATDDEVRMKEAALVSKTLRTLGLRLIPGDLLDEAAQQIQTTLDNADAADPDGERKRLIDRFAELGIKPHDLVEYLAGKPLDALTPADRSELRGVYAAVRDGERWSEILEASPHRQTGEATAKPKSEAAARLRSKLEERRKPKAQATAATAPTAAPERVVVPDAEIEPVAEAQEQAPAMREPGDES